MSTAATNHSTPEIELGHPVRSFVSVLLLVWLLLLALQWTGAVQPQVKFYGAGSSSFEPGWETSEVGLRNEGLLAVDIVDIEWPDPRGIESEIGLAPSPDIPRASLDATLDPFEAFTLEAGETAWIGIRTTPECADALGPPVLTVRTATGLHRDVRIGEPNPQDSQGCQR